VHLVPPSVLPCRPCRRCGTCSPPGCGAWCAAWWCTPGPPCGHRTGRYTAGAPSTTYSVLVTINLGTECLKWHSMLQQMQERMLCQALHVHVDNDTQKVQSSDWLKWCCVLWRYVIFCLSPNEPSIIYSRKGYNGKTFQVMRQWWTFYNAQWNNKK